VRDDWSIEWPLGALHRANCHAERRHKLADEAVLCPDEARQAVAEMACDNLGGKRFGSQRMDSNHFAAHLYVGLGSSTEMAPQLVQFCGEGQPLAVATA